MQQFPLQNIRKIEYLGYFDLSLLHTPYLQFLFVFEQRGSKVSKRESRKRKKYFAVPTRTCRAECYLHHPGTCLASQALSFESAQSLLALLEQRARVHLLFSTSPGLAALLRSDGFFSGAVCFVRRTLARSAFHGFSIGFKRCKIV